MGSISRYPSRSATRNRSRAVISDRIFNPEKNELRRLSAENVCPSPTTPSAATSGSQQNTTVAPITRGPQARSRRGVLEVVIPITNTRRAVLRRLAQPKVQEGSGLVGNGEMEIGNEGNPRDRGCEAGMAGIKALGLIVTKNTDGPLSEEVGISHRVPSNLDQVLRRAAEVRSDGTSEPDGSGQANTISHVCSSDHIVPSPSFSTPSTQSLSGTDSRVGASIVRSGRLVDMDGSEGNTEEDEQDLLSSHGYSSTRVSLNEESDLGSVRAFQASGSASTPSGQPSFKDQEPARLVNLDQPLSSLSNPSEVDTEPETHGERFDIAQITCIRQPSPPLPSISLPTHSDAAHLANPAQYPLVKKRKRVRDAIADVSQDAESGDLELSPIVSAQTTRQTESETRSKPGLKQRVASGKVARRRRMKKRETEDVLMDDRNENPVRIVGPSVVAGGKERIRHTSHQDASKQAEVTTAGPDKAKGGRRSRRRKRVKVTNGEDGENQEEAMRIPQLDVGTIDSTTQTQSGTIMSVQAAPLVATAPLRLISPIVPIESIGNVTSVANTSTVRPDTAVLPTDLAPADTIPQADVAPQPDADAPITAPAPPESEHAFLHHLARHHARSTKVTNRDTPLQHLLRPRSSIHYRHLSDASITRMRTMDLGYPQPPTVVGMSSTPENVIKIYEHLKSAPVSDQMLRPSTELFFFRGVELWDRVIHPNMDTILDDQNMVYPKPTFDYKQVVDLLSVEAKFRDWKHEVTIASYKACIIGGSPSDNKALRELLGGDIAEDFNHRYSPLLLQVLAAKLDAQGRLGQQGQRSMRIFSGDSMGFEGHRPKGTKELGMFIDHCSSTPSVHAFGGWFTWRTKLFAYSYEFDTRTLAVATSGAVMDDDLPARHSFDDALRIFKDAICQRLGLLPSDVQVIFCHNARHATSSMEGPIIIFVLEMFMYGVNPYHPPDEVFDNLDQLLHWLPRARLHHARMLLDDHFCFTALNQKLQFFRQIMLDTNGR